MDKKMRKDAQTIIDAGIKAVLPDEAVRRALEGFEPGSGRTVWTAKPERQGDSWLEYSAAMGQTGGVWPILPAARQ